MKYTFSKRIQAQTVEDDYIAKKVEQIMYRRAQWIDELIRLLLPEWKIRILLILKFRFIRKLLNVNIEIENLEVPRGLCTTVLLNGKVVGINTFRTKFT